MALQDTEFQLEVSWVYNLNHSKTERSILLAALAISGL